MKIEFEIQEFPKNNEGYNIITNTEGLLKISIEDYIYINETGILLIEFAIFIYKWLLKLKQGEITDFYYSSMDFEEEPIFCLRYDLNKNLFTLISVWNKDLKQHIISKAEAIQLFETYINDLQQSLKKNQNYILKLDKIIDL